MRSYLIVLALAGCSVDPVHDLGVGPTGIMPSGPLRLAEGQTSTFTVSLVGDAPQDELIVALAANGAVAAVEPQRLVFTAADFRAERVVAVTATADGDYDFAAGSIDLTSPGIPSKSVPVTVVEPELVGFDMDTSTPCPNEPVLLGIWLRGNPHEMLRLNVTATNGMDVDTDEIVFDPETYEQMQGAVAIPNYGPTGSQITLESDDKVVSTTLSLNVRSDGDPRCPQ